jgi:hypothetical protein
LVNTVHGEKGANTVASLVALLERLAPDVVFAEIPASYSDRYADGSHGNVESRAVAEYRRHHQLSVVPVDSDPPDEQFFSEAKDMFDLLERRSRDYRNVVDLHLRRVETDGLRYLNSDETVQAWDAIHDETLASIDWLRESRLRDVYDRWLAVIESRDSVMLTNIAAYASRHPSSHGVFLVGAAHRKSIVKKVQDNEGIADWQTELPDSLFL